SQRLGLRTPGVAAQSTGPPIDDRDLVPSPAYGPPDSPIAMPDASTSPRTRPRAGRGSRGALPSIFPCAAGGVYPRSPIRRRSRSIKAIRRTREEIMLDRSSTATIGVAAFLALTIVTIGGACAADEAKYPDWKGQWGRFAVKLPTQPSHDQT